MVYVQCASKCYDDFLDEMSPTVKNVVSVLSKNLKNETNIWKHTAKKRNEN